MNCAAAADPEIQPGRTVTEGSSAHRPLIRVHYLLGLRPANETGKGREVKYFHPASRRPGRSRHGEALPIQTMRCPPTRLGLLSCSAEPRSPP